MTWAILGGELLRHWGVGSTIRKDIVCAVKGKIAVSCE